MNPTTLVFSNPAEENVYLKSQIQQLESLVENLQTTIRNQQHRMEELLKRLYGRVSEKCDPNQMLMEEIILAADHAVISPLDAAPAVRNTVVASHTRCSHGRQIFPEHLKRVEHILDTPEKEKTCDCCGKALARIGEDVTERIDYEPSSLFVNRYVRPKYACGDCNCLGSGVKQHPTPEGPVERCEADTGILAHVIEEKYEHHNPLYRQELRFRRQGIDLSRQTMADWMAGCAQALKPVWETMRAEILKYDIVLNDDTPIDMRTEDSGNLRTARLWVTVGGEGLKYTLYNFTIDRCREGPQEFFKGYRGYFVSDAYGGYNGLFTTGEIVNAACWTHARRYFVKAQDVSPQAATQILTLIAWLYRIEAQIKGDTPDRKLHVRQDTAAPILNKIKDWLDANISVHLPQSPMRKAIEYTLGIWSELNVYLKDGRIPIDNNLAENAMRPVALGRKNWLFVGSENGGHTAAVLMSFCATCRKNKINTWKYLRDVLQRIQSHPASRVYELLPDRWQLSQ